MAIKQNQRQRYKILKPKASVFTLASIQYFKKSRTRVAYTPVRLDVNMIMGPIQPVRQA